MIAGPRCRSDEAHYEVTLDETKAVPRLRDGLDLTAAAKTSVEAGSTIADLIAVLNGRSEPPAAAGALLASLQAWPKKSLREHVIKDYLSRISGSAYQ